MRSSNGFHDQWSLHRCPHHEFLPSCTTIRTKNLNTQSHIYSMLCVVGMPGSGKSLFLDVVRGYGFQIVSMGDEVRAETGRRGLPPEMHGKVAEDLRKERGRAAVAHLVVDKTTRDCIVDGVRGLEEVKVFKERKFPLVTVAIYASPRTRFKRLKIRQRAGDPKTWKEFKKRDKRELQFGIGDVIALADYVLVNESSKEQFEKECRVFLNKRRRKL